VKFKRCHGSLHAHADIHADIRAHLETARRQMDVTELQRARQQGNGRPIVSAGIGDQRVVVVGGVLRTGNWKTFADFLHDYIKISLGSDWGNAELAKPEAVRHPILYWYQELGRLQAEHRRAPGEISGMPTFGVARAYLGLAYDLYLLDHNTESTPNAAARDRLLHRLKHPDQFVGARYELRIAAFFLRAGFQLQWTDETDPTRRHGEFLAIFPETGRTFWVECKIRQAKPKSDGSTRLGKFVSLVVDALRKPTTLDRFVFVDLNTPAESKPDADAADWRVWAVGKLRTLEGSPLGRELPPALIMVTNFPENHHLNTWVPDAGGAIEGFKMDGFRMGQPMTLPEAIEQRAQHPEVGIFLSSMAEHYEVPSTFDGTIPGLEELSNRLRIGERYEVAPGISGILVEACVMDPEPKVAAVIQMDDGSQGIHFMPLSDEEMTVWRRYPETFFGDVREHNGPSKSPLDLYDFFHKAMLKTSKEQILAQIQHWPNQAELAALAHADLAHRYALALTEAAVASSGGFPMPMWTKRIRPPPK
jgi:hypothetical protein